LKHDENKQKNLPQRQVFVHVVTHLLIMLKYWVNRCNFWQR